MEEKIDRKSNENLDYPENSSGMSMELKQLSKESWYEICEYRRLLDALDYQNASWNSKK